MVRFGGILIMEDASRVVFDREDWSRVRSPGRAARRRSKHRQNIVMLYKPDPNVIQFGDRLIMHPAIAAEVRRQVREAQVMFDEIEVSRA